MGRWEPNARERLERAALDLFHQQGYESTTVAEIAERAGLAKSTFFRHFTDKREVLFGEPGEMARLFGDAITGAPDAASPIDAVGAALDAVAHYFGTERRPWAQKRQAVIARNCDLQERELLKLSTLTTAMAGALRERGVPEPAAALAAEIGGLAFRTAFARWIDPPCEQDFATLVRQDLDGLRVAASELDRPSTPEHTPAERPAAT